MGVRIEDIDLLNGKITNEIKIPVSNGSGEAVTMNLWQLKRLLGYDEVVVGKSIPLGAMPYHWYYCKNHLNLKRNFEGWTVYLDGTKITFEYDEKNMRLIYHFGISCRLYRVAKRNEETNEVWIESKPLKNVVPTLCDGVYIKNRDIVCEREVVVNVQDINAKPNDMIASSFENRQSVCRKFLRKCGRCNYNDTRYRVLRFVNKHDSHIRQMVMYVRALAKGRWKSKNGIVVNNYHT